MKKAHSIITIVTILIALATINLIAARHPVRLDLTDNGLYTLSDSTKSILKGLQDVVTAKVYFTGNLPPSLEPLRSSVDDLLSEFKQAAGNNFQIQFIDPSANAMDEQKAAMLGIPPVQLNVFDKDKQEVAKIYLGIAIMYGDNQQVLPVVRGAENLEYDLAEAIVKVTSPSLPAIGWLDIGGIAQPGINFSYAREGLSRRYDLKSITEKNLDLISPEKISVLIIASPKDIGADAINSVKSFLAAGGKLAVFADKIVLGQALDASEQSSDIIDKLSEYGVTVENSLVFDRTSAMAAFSGGPVTYHIPYPLWPDVRRAQFNQKDPISADLETIVLPWTSALALSKESESAGASIPLAFSSADSCSIPVKDTKLDPQSTADALVKCEKQPQILAAIVNTAISAEGMAGNVSGGKIFITGSSRWISDGYLENFPANANLFENAIDSLALQGKLIGIRAKDSSLRPIVTLSDAERMFFKYANLIVGPVIAILIGLGFFLTKKRRVKKLHAEYSKPS